VLRSISVVLVIAVKRAQKNNVITQAPTEVGSEVCHIVQEAVLL